MMKNAQTIRKAAATTAVLLFLSAVTLLNGIAFQFLGFVDTLLAGIFGGGSLLLVATVAVLARRYLLLPTYGVVGLAFLLITLTWACPVTPRTRFFARTARVQVGMPVRQARTLLADTDLTFVTPHNSAFSPPPGQGLICKQPDARFSGFIACKPHRFSGDIVTINIRDGIVTGVHPYANL